MINSIPILGWALSVVGSISLAVPFWICWTACGIGSRYFAFLPSNYHAIPFWDCVGLFIVISILKAGVPSFASVSQKVEPAKEKS
jgi:hypothetical protein